MKGSPEPDGAPRSPRAPEAASPAFGGADAPPAVECRSLSYRYADGTEALRDISFSVAPGERVGLIGPNGAGKSTLLLHLNGLLPERLPVESPIRISGRPVATPDLAWIRAEVGLLFQDPDDQLFCPTVREDIAFGPQQLGLGDAETEERVARTLETVGLAGFGDRAPHHLSQGEKRRVALAGLLVCRPSVLVLDEPTSDLDPRGRRELERLLHDLPVTQIIATHDLELVVKLCPRVIVLDGGRIVAEGRSVEVLDDELNMEAHGLERPHILRHHHPH